LRAPPRNPTAPHQPPFKQLTPLNALLCAAKKAGAAREPSLEEVAFEIEALIGRPSGGPLAEFELHLQAARDPELREASARCFAAYEDLARSGLGLLGVSEPSGHASAFVALVTGLSVRRLGTDSADAEAVTGALLTLLGGRRPKGDRSPLDPTSGLLSGQSAA
jgi:hypothetical protein